MQFTNTQSSNELQNRNWMRGYRFKKSTDDHQGDICYLAMSTQQYDIP